MIKLKIKESGHIFKAFGIPEVRTPVEVIITQANISSVIANLKSQGITNYKIVEVDKPVVKKKEIKSKPKSNPTEEDMGVLKILQNLVNKLISDKRPSTIDVQDRLSNIENMMKELISRPITKFIGKEIQVDDEPFIKKKPGFEEEESLFVPKIQTSGMKIQSTESTFKQEEADSEAENSSDLLTKIRKKKPNKFN